MNCNEFYNMDVYLHLLLYVDSFIRLSPELNGSYQ